MNAPFTNLSEKKIRPALVLAKIEDDLLICFIGSKKSRSPKYDVVLRADMENKLRIDSVIKCNKIFTLHASLSKGVLGRISLEKYKTVVQKITAIIQ